jgi:two-component system, NarL family, invasion response regulator UvrY
VARDNGDAAIRVLIVEDDLRVRTALRSFLAASPGFEVVGVAADVPTALKLARETAPAVVIVDILLPDARHGLGLVSTLARELGLPTVAMSIDGWVGADALAAGARRFLDKDSAPERLPAALRAAVSGPPRT